VSSLEEIYGIGEIRAAQLRERGFESIQDIAMASLADLTVLEGVGDSRARTIRDDARERLYGEEYSREQDEHETIPSLAGHSGGAVSEGDVDRLADLVGGPTGSGGSGTAEHVTSTGEYVTVCDVAAEDVDVVAPGDVLVTAVGETDYPELLAAAVVSLPGSAVLELWGQRADPDAELANLALETAVILFSPVQLADVAPSLYERLASREGVAVSETFPNAAFLSPTVSAISGATILDVREQHPQLEDDVRTLLTNGTVLVDGSAFDFENPHEVSVLESAGVYVRGDRALPDGVVFPAETTVSDACSLPATASFLHPDVVSVPGNAAIERECATTDRAPLTVARASPTAERASSTLPLVAQSGILLPPGAVQREKQ
jgi:hypothetical protein